MTKLVDETQFATENLDSDTYKERISKLEEDLHELRDELADVEKRVLQDQGYKPINIEEATIMVPVGMSMEQLYVSLQQMPPPNENTNRAMKDLVSDEDKEAVRESEEYNSVVEERRQKIQDIKDIYKEFWTKEVQTVADSQIEQISYMLAGLERNIRSRKLSNVTGISMSECKKFSLVDGTVEMKTDTMV